MLLLFSEWFLLPTAICSETLPHHRSITLSHQSFRRCRTDELLQLHLQNCRSNVKHNIGEGSIHHPSHLFHLINMVTVHHLVIREVALHDPQTLLRRACCTSTVNDHRITDLSCQSTNPDKHLCLLLMTFVLPHPNVIQTCLSHSDTIKDLMRSKNTSGYFSFYVDNISIKTYST